MYDPLNLAEFVGRRRADLADLGVMLETRDDFEALFDLDLPGKKISEMFSPRHHDLLDQRARWICGSIDGQIVHVQAYRLIDTGTSTMERALRSEFNRVFGPPAAVPLGSIADALEEMCGRIVYHGDLWCHERLRGTGAGEKLGAIGVGSAMMTFDPDYVIGFMEQPLAGRGFFFREGYFHVEPLGAGYLRGAPFLLEDDWLVYCTRASLRKLVQRDVQQNRVKQPVTLFEPKVMGNTSR